MNIKEDGQVVVGDNTRGVDLGCEGILWVTRL